MNRVDSIMTGLIVWTIVLFVAVGLSYDTIQEKYYDYKIRNGSLKYSNCGVCGDAFSHKDMTWKEGKWYCDYCYTCLNQWVLRIRR